MADLGPDITAEVVAACQANAGEVAAALSRALDTVVKLAVRSPKQIAISQLPDDFEGPGLTLAWPVGNAGVVALLPESSGLLPAWYLNPDATGKSKLGTLAQELGLLLLPEQFQPSQFHAVHLPHLGDALKCGRVADELSSLPLAIESSRGEHGALMMIWPVPQLADMLATGTVVSLEPAQDAAMAAPGGQSAFAVAAHTVRRSTGVESAAPASVEELPGYSRSLLRIRVPVTVSLATKKQRLGAILEIGQGSIVQFDKPCDEMLELEIGGHRIALGEAVKVGDKFGLRITSIVLPDERLLPLARS